MPRQKGALVIRVYIYINTHTHTCIYIYTYMYTYMCGWHMVQGAVASWQGGTRFESRFGWGLHVWILHVLPMSVWVCSRYSGFLPQSKDFGLNKM